MKKTDALQGKASKVLSKIVLDAHLTTSRAALPSNVKTAVAGLGDLSDADLKALPGLFDSLREKAKKSQMGDQGVVTSLRLAAAAAGMAVVDAKQCTELLQVQKK